MLVPPHAARVHGRQATLDGLDEEIMEPFLDAIPPHRQEDSSPMGASPPADGHVVGDLAALYRHAPLAQLHFSSHRKVLGWVVLLIKQGLCRLLLPILERQTAYNTTNAHLVSSLCTQVDLLRQQCPLVPEEVNTSRPPPMEAIPQRVQTHYEEGWDRYSERWETSVQQPGMQYVGDEWGSPALCEDIIHRYVKPYLPADARALELGCGEGKYSAKLAPLCTGLICADVSGRMIERAKQRLHGLTNIEFAKLNGLDLRPFASESINFVFSFDCFVHIEIEDVYCYLQEIKRVLKPAGRGLLHFANLNSEEGWHKFITEASINRGRQKHFDRFCFLTWEIVEKFFGSLELNIVTSQREPWRDILVVFQKGAH
jgi:SAM-dependent methyltransferase